MASTDRKTRKARNRQRRVVEQAAKLHRAATEAGIPLHRFSDHDTEQGGIAANRLEVTGLGIGGRPSFVRAPNKALSLYRAKDLITAQQYEAGVRLWLDYEESSIPPAIVPEMGRIMVDGGRLPDWPLPNIDAHRRLAKAIAAVEGSIGRAMIIRVCLHGDTLAEGVFAHYPDPKQKMARFREALDHLKRHYEKQTTR